MNKTKEKTSDKLMDILLKEAFTEHTITTLSNRLGLTRQGVWKSLKRLKEGKKIILKSIADTKKSAVNVRLNFSNIIIEKSLSLMLVKESLEYERWRNNFNELENVSDFVLLYGSILINPKQANDIDVLVIVNDKRYFKQVEEITSKIQKTQEKEIHLVDLTVNEFKEELLKKNKAYLDALKKGVVLFGQENFIKFIKSIYGN